MDELFIIALNSGLLVRKFYENAWNRAQSEARRSFFQSLMEFEERYYQLIAGMIEPIGRQIEVPSIECGSIPEVRPGM